jgi:hypothetical protein
MLNAGSPVGGGDKKKKKSIFFSNKFKMRSEKG